MDRVQQLLQEKADRLDVFTLGNISWTTMKRDRRIQQLLEITPVHKNSNFYFNCHSQHAGEVGLNVHIFKV